MKFLPVLALLAAAVHGVAIPEEDTAAAVALYQSRSQHEDRDADYGDLWKRRGGGGGGGRGGGGSSGGSGSSGSGSSGSSGSGRGGSSGSSSSGRGSSGSNSGGSTTTGSGVRPSYGGGRVYGGGAASPYQAGKKTPGGLSPYPFVFAGAALAFWPGLWLHGAYLYPYSHPWGYHNASSNKNESKPVICGCDQYEECGCEDNSNSTYIDSVIGNGSYDSLNKSLVTVAKVNGTDTILINGTLPNGTTSSGGDESPDSAAGMLQHAGWWPVVAAVGAMVLMC